jgi:hypothetical protein
MTLLQQNVCGSGHLPIPGTSSPVKKRRGNLKGLNGVNLIFRNTNHPPAEAVPLLERRRRGNFCATFLFCISILVEARKFSSQSRRSTHDLP